MPYSTLVFDQISLGFKRNKHGCNFHYDAMPMVASQILKTVDFTKTQKFRYLENKTLTFFQKKKKKKENSINYTSRATLWQKMIL